MKRVPGPLPTQSLIHLPPNLLQGAPGWLCRRGVTLNLGVVGSSATRSVEIT